MDGSLGAQERRQALTGLLADPGRIEIADVAARLDVHPMTIRRDLKALERAGSVRLVRGGAIAVGPHEFAVRQSKALSAKRKIATKLAPLVAGHASIGIDASTTMLAFIEYALPVTPGTLVVTYGIPSFQALQARSGIRVFLSGGEYDPMVGSLVGPLAQRALSSFALSCCFLSCAALDAELGSTEPSLEEAEMKLAMVGSAQNVVLAVDSTKLGRRSVARSVALAGIDVLVTELNPADPGLNDFRGLVNLL